MDNPSLPTLRRIDAAHHLHSVHRPRDLHRKGTRIIRAGLRLHGGRRERPQAARRARRPVVRQRRLRPRGDRRRGVRADDAVAFYPSFFNTTTEPTIRLAGKLAPLAPERLQPRVLQQLRLGGERDGAEADPRLPEAARPARKTKILTRTFAYHGVTLATTSMTGLPSCTEPFDLPLPGFIHVPGPHAYGATGMTRRRLRRVVPRGDRAHHRARGRRHDRGALRRADPGRGRRDRAAARLPHSAARALPAPRHPVRRRRSDHRLRPARRLVRVRALGARSRPHDPREGLTSGYLPLGATMVSDEIADVARCTAATSRTASPTAAIPSPAPPALANLEIIEHERLVERVRDDIGPVLPGEAARLRRPSGGRRSARLSAHRRARTGCRAAASAALTPPDRARRQGAQPARATKASSCAASATSSPWRRR